MFPVPAPRTKRNAKEVEERDWTMKMERASMSPGRNMCREQGGACAPSELEATGSEWKDERESRLKDIGFVAVILALVFMCPWDKWNNENWCLKKCPCLNNFHRLLKKGDCRCTAQLDL